MIRKDFGNTEFTYFDSLTDLIETPIRNPSNQLVIDSFADLHTGDELQWFGLRGGRKEVEKTLITGWPDGVKLMNECLQTVDIPTAPSVRRKRRRGDSGNELDIHRVLSGRMDRAWLRTVKDAGARGNRNVTIAVRYDAGGSTTAKEAVWRGVAAMAIAKAATMSGRNVRIIAVDSTSRAFPNATDGVTCSAHAVCIKQYTQQIADEILSSVVALIGTYRVYGFRAILSSERNGWQGIGGMHEFDMQMLKDEAGAEDFIFVPSDVLSREQALDCIRSSVATFSHDSDQHLLSA